jgi:hypothetical protein
MEKDVIIVSGFNVYPNEVEAIATGCPGVIECAERQADDGRADAEDRRIARRAAEVERRQDFCGANCGSGGDGSPPARAPTAVTGGALSKNHRTNSNGARYL